VGITFSRLAFSYWIDNLGFLLRENLAAIFITPSSWGSQLAGHLLGIKLFFGAVAGEEEDFCKGSFRTHILYFVYCFSLLYFTCIILSKTQKN
jgi:hypothetical protein